MGNDQKLERHSYGDSTRHHEREMPDNKRLRLQLTVGHSVQLVTALPTSGGPLIFF